MQEIKIYVSAASSLGVIRDYANAKNVAAPTLVRGCEVMLKLRLFADSYGEDAYPIEQLDNVTHWQFVMDKDFDESTSYIIEADNSAITVASVTDIINETERNFTEISIPLVNVNTEQLNEWLGKDKSKVGMYAELIGYDASGDDIFVLQLENFAFRNRIVSIGSPTELDPEYMTAAQVQAIAEGLQKQINEIGNTNNAADIIISAESQFYAGLDVEAALQQIGSELDGLEAELEGI